MAIRGAGREIGRTRADPQGSWVFLPSEPLEPGARELTLSARDPDGREAQGQGSVLLVVPERSPATASQATPPLAVLTGRDAASRLLQAPPSGAEAPTALGAKRLGLDVVDYDEHGDVRFAGTASPGAPVRLYIDDRPAGDAVADADGRWVLTPTVGVAPGSHRLRVDQLTPSGQVAARAEVPFRRETQAPGGFGEGRVVVQRGQNLWQLARHAYGSGLRYTVIFQANREQNPRSATDLPGQTFAVPAAAAPSSPSAPVTPTPPSRVEIAEACPSLAGTRRTIHKPEPGTEVSPMRGRQGNPDRKPCPSPTRSVSCLRRRTRRADRSSWEGSSPSRWASSSVRDG